MAMTHAANALVVTTNANTSPAVMSDTIRIRIDAQPRPV